MLCRMSNLTKKEIDEYWHKGLRAFEIYTLNDKPATYFGKEYKEGELSGWDTKIVLAKEEDLKYCYKIVENKAEQ